MMDEKEARRMAVIEKTLEGKFKNQQAADLLHLLVRQAKRLKAKVRKGDATAILHGNRGRKPHNAIPEFREKKIIEFAEGELKEDNLSHNSKKPFTIEFDMIYSLRPALAKYVVVIK